MSKRAEAAALKAYQPETKKAIELLPMDWNEPKRTAFIQGYEQAEKETIERAKQWIIRQRGFGKMALLDFQKFMGEE